MDERQSAVGGTLTVRPARAADAEAIARIYNQGIDERIATFETEPRTASYIRSLLAERGDRFPTVVVERAGAVIAFAGVGPYRDRPCYAGVGEFSVYTERSGRRAGAGTAALRGLAAECERRGYWKLVSRIFEQNAASRALHRSVGFREVGVYRRHARLDGAWVDCVIVELLLGDGQHADEAHEVQATAPRPEQDPRREPPANARRSPAPRRVGASRSPGR